MSGVELDDSVRAVGELSLPLGGGAAVLVAYQVGGWYLVPGRGSDRLLGDRQALVSQVACRVIDQRGAIVHEGLAKYLRAHGEGAGLDVDGKKRRRLGAAERGGDRRLRGHVQRRRELFRPADNGWP